MKNPFCTLPVSLKNIVVHSKAEIPGEYQYNVLIFKLGIQKLK